MFTGIILAIGKVERLEALGGDYQLTFNTGQLSLDDVNIGDSIAVNGVCLTAVELTANSFSADVEKRCHGLLWVRLSRALRLIWNWP
jgi:riboflavin synthase